MRLASHQPDRDGLGRGGARAPVLSPDGYAAMPLHMKASAAASEQQRRAFASEDSLSAGGAASISKKKKRKKKKAQPGILGLRFGGGGPSILRKSRGLDLTCRRDVLVSVLLQQSIDEASNQEKTGSLVDSKSVNQ